MLPTVDDALEDLVRPVYEGRSGGAADISSCLCSMRVLLTCLHVCVPARVCVCHAVVFVVSRGVRQGGGRTLRALHKHPVLRPGRVPRHRRVLSQPWHDRVRHIRCAFCPEKHPVWASLVLPDFGLLFPIPRPLAWCRTFSCQIAFDTRNYTLKGSSVQTGLASWLLHVHTPSHYPIRASTACC